MAFVPTSYLLMLAIVGHQPLSFRLFATGQIVTVDGGQLALISAGMNALGQESGDFDASLFPDRLLTAGLAIGRAAEDEVNAGRMSTDDARNAVHRSFLPLFGLSGL